MGKNKNISNCRVVKILLSMLNVKESLMGIRVLSVLPLYLHGCMYFVIAILQMIMFFIYMLIGLNGLLH